MPDTARPTRTTVIPCLRYRDAPMAIKWLCSVFGFEDEDHGGRGFTCRDLEGHLWNVGTYDPW